MSRIGTFADDDLAGWVLKSPDLGSAIGAFANAVYSKNRLPMRTRELARTVIAHSNECEVCVNTRDADGPANGVDEELYDHADQWRTWPGYSDQERLAAEFAYRFATEHTVLRDDEDFWTRCQRALFRGAARRPGAVVRAMDRHGTSSADPGYRAVLPAHPAKPGMNHRAR